jgi:hypothetical protein
MIRFYLIGLIILFIAVDPAFSDSKTKPDKFRGAMLYENHCLECHTLQSQWQQKKRVTDRKSLVTEIDHWQQTSGLEWNQRDIDEVSHYLNDRLYHYEY